jgi:hypothetical protein
MHGRAHAAGRRLIRLVVAGLLLSFGVPAAAWADTFVVTSTADKGGCEGTTCASLRGALASARDGDTIRLPSGRYEQAEGEFTVTRSVSILGDGAGRTVVGGDSGRIFVVGDPQRSAPPVVLLADLQLTGGHDLYGRGGNIRNSGRLTLDRVHVTRGVASRGGGVANVDGGRLVVRRSLIDGNVATGLEWSGQGGGIYSDADGEDALVVEDSTIHRNQAVTGAGIAIGGAGELRIERAARLERVTLARNHATAALPGGLRAGMGAPVSVRGSIVAHNTAEPASRERRVEQTSAPVPSNCAGPVLGARAGNLAEHDDCGFGLEGDPLLSAEPVPGLGSTPVLTIASPSPAVDLAGACAGTDQRGLARPQGEGCDAGAFEVAAPAIDAGPDATTTAASPVFAFSSELPGTAFECRLDGPGGVGSWQPCVSPKRYDGLVPGGYRFAVRAAGSTAQADRPFTVLAPAAAPLPQPQPQPPIPTPTPTPTPAPEYRRSVVVKPTRGSVKVRLPGTRRYVELGTLDRLPLGASIDVRKGRVRLYAVARPGARPQAASFYGGVFRVVQRGSVIELQLRGPVPRCGSRTASAAQDKKRKARKRKLWGSGKGRFRTRGRYSAATVRGTVWLVVDDCRTTTTRVRRGSVKVRDFAQRETIVLRRGDRYVARRR